MNNIIIGLDCGASHSSLAVWEDEKIVKKISDMRGVNFDLISMEEARQYFLIEFESLAKYKDAYWVVGMAGLDDPGEIAEAEKWFRGILESSISYSGLAMMSDIEMVLWAGSDTGTGIGVIAGTGSNCLSRNTLGEIKKAGGLSHILSDEGGGFSIGWKCLHLVAKMTDGRAKKTDLFNMVMDLYETNNIIELKNYFVFHSDMKAQVARSAPLLIKSAANGDSDAGEIVAEEVRELLKMVMAVSVDPKDSEMPVYLAGSVFKDNHYQNLFSAALHKYFPFRKVIMVDPIEGAFRYAKKSI